MASRFDKIDAHVNGPDDDNEVPEVTAEAFASGRLMRNGQPVERAPGDLTSESDTRQVVLELDRTVIEGFQATGPGWQSRMNAVLRDWLTRRAA